MLRHRRLRLSPGKHDQAEQQREHGQDGSDHRPRLAAPVTDIAENAEGEPGQPEWEAIANNRALGFSRQMVVQWLWKSQRKDEAGEIALSQLSDESVVGHALEALARLRT